MPSSSAVRTGSRPSRRDELLQILAVDVLEDDELAPVGLAAVDDGDDVRMLEPCGRPRLTPEALDVVLVARVVLVEDLDRNGSLEQAVVRPVDAGHASFADELLELVAARDHLADHSAAIVPGVRADEAVASASAEAHQLARRAPARARPPRRRAPRPARRR